MHPDDDALLQALHGGVFETPLWSGFLRKMEAKTGARRVSLMYRPLDRDSILTRHIGAEEAPDLLPQIADVMRPERAYALEEVLDALPEPAAVRAALQTTGHTAMRAVRVEDVAGVDLCLACFGGRNIGAATSALLTALAPHLRIALKTLTALERARFRSAVSEQVATRLRMGWFTLDARCRILECTDNIEQMFQWGTLLRRGRYDRLVPASPALDRDITALVKSFGINAEAKPQAFVLSQDPWVDMLVAQVAPGAFAGGLAAAAIVYVRGDRRSQADRCEQLVDLFGLLPSEARLAWILAQATSISEAAEALGLTVETARNYSKKIYAKTGARGHADLVRIILTSVLAIS